jgi:predicted RND superfamily exporter protein
MRQFFEFGRRALEKFNGGGGPSGGVKDPAPEAAAAAQSDDDSALGEAAARRPIALGIERLGLISLAHPVVVGVIFVVVTIAAALGLGRLEVDDSLSRLFQSDTPEFRQYDELTRRFPSNEFDVLVVVEGKSLLKRESLEKFRDMVTDLQLIEGTRGLVSMFSARQPPEGDEIPAPLFPADLPEGAGYNQLIARVMSNDIIRGKLLSEDGELALVVLALEPEVVRSSALSSTIREIQQTIQNDLGGSGLSVKLSGVPVMQLEIRNAVERDRLIYNAFGFALGCLIAVVFFGRPSFMIIAAAPPLVAILLALGTLGWLGFRLNMFLNVMTPLIMVITFSDSMQLTFAARARLLAGDDKYQAFRNALHIVGPACVLTHGAAALSFIALQISESELIRAFGLAGLIASLIALVAVLTLIPLLGILLLRTKEDVAPPDRTIGGPLNALQNFCGWIAAKMVTHPGRYTLAGIVIIALLGVVYTNLQPRYRLADQVPDREQAVAASSRIDTKLTGSNPIDIMIQFPPGESLYSPRSLAIIAQVHSVLERQRGIGNVWSLETLRRWLDERDGKSDVKTLKLYVNMLPEYLTRRFISAEEDAVVVTGRVPDADASRLLPIVQELDRTLDTVRAQFPGYTVAVTGLSALAARNSALMIDKLNRGLTIEIVFVAVFIGVAFGSLVVMLAVIPPAIFPVFLAGTVLWTIGEGLQFASAIALIVSFGLGLSATIHFLNRLRFEETPHEDPKAGVERATVQMGPPLVVTSIVLACGLAVTVFSDLPSLRLFGWLSALAMLAALVADFLILRPTFTYLRMLPLFRHRLRSLG